MAIINLYNKKLKLGFALLACANYTAIIDFSQIIFTYYLIIYIVPPPQPRQPPKTLYKQPEM